MRIECAVGVAPQQQFGLKFGSVNIICVDSMRIRFASRERDFNVHRVNGTSMRIQTGSSVKGP